MEFLVVIALIIGFLLGRFALVKNRGAVKHDHIWKMLDSSHRTQYNTSNPTKHQIPTARTTRILQGCFCGEHNVKEINGHWDFNKLKELEV